MIVICLNITNKNHPFHFALIILLKFQKREKMMCQYNMHIIMDKIIGNNFISTNIN